MDPLLAKSYDRNRHKDSPPSYALLTQHSRDVAAACDALSSIVGRVALHNAGLSQELFEDFQVALRINGWMQDLGKASDHFQEMVANPFEARKQLMRHEVISGTLFWNDSLPLARWFNGLHLSFPLRLASVWGAIGHHRKFDEDTKPENCNRLKVCVTHDDFKAILTEMSASLKVSPPDDFKRDVVFAYSRREADTTSGEIGAFESIRDLQNDFEELKGEFAEYSSRRVLALIKVFGIAADVAASAVAKDEYKMGRARTDYISRFVEEKLSVGLTVEELGELGQKRLADSAKRTCVTRTDDSTLAENSGDERNLFQKEVAQSGRGGAFLTIARAGCGSGKSIAAYKWAQAWCERFAHENRNNFRLFFCLPTTGTTTEHYKDYALESGIENAALVHSRRDVDLMEIAHTAPQESATEGDGDQRNAARQALSEMRDRIESLELWSTPLIVSTTDTVLGLMANARRAIYGIPAIMSGAIVFDEIHAYDDQLFGHLLVFLKNFPRLPTLLMTASLPEERLREIRYVRPDLEDSNIVEGPPAFENLKRYVVRKEVSDEDVNAAIEDCIRKEGKVLWVCNRVARANDTYRACREGFVETNINVYHSRFRYIDRSRRHRRVIDDFNCSGRAAILVATQVAEMSLDLSADLLITDIAPVPALIQRMGRLNRRALPSDPEDLRTPKPALIKSLLVDEQANPLPYQKEEIEAAWKWLEKLRERGDVLSQRDLAETFAGLGTQELNLERFMKRAEINACFFSGLWRTRPGETRVDGYTVSVVLQDDVENCDDFAPNGEPSRNWIRKHEVSIPFKPEVLRWPRVGTVREAPRNRVAYDYDPRTGVGTGAEWKH